MRTHRIRASRRPMHYAAQRLCLRCACALRRSYAASVPRHVKCLRPFEGRWRPFSPPWCTGAHTFRARLVLPHATVSPRHGSERATRISTAQPVQGMAPTASLADICCSPYDRPRLRAWCRHSHIPRTRDAPARCGIAISPKPWRGRAARDGTPRLDCQRSALRPHRQSQIGRVRCLAAFPDGTTRCLDPVVRGDASGVGLRRGASQEERGATHSA